MNCSVTTISNLRKECIENGEWFSEEELEEITKKLNQEKAAQKLKAREQLYRRTKNTL